VALRAIVFSLTRGKTQFHIETAYSSQWAALLFRSAIWIRWFSKNLS
jgi:hypothetical protein